MNNENTNAPMLKALIFDVDGTLADTEMAHLAAFNHAFAEVGLDWHWSVALYAELLNISGGKERIEHYWRGQSPDMRVLDVTAFEDRIARIHEIKSAAYEQAIRDGLVQLRPGVLALLSAARQAGLQVAIATTTSPGNISALLRKAIGPDWGLDFSVIEDASTAPRKKPHPQVYQQALRRLGLPAANCLAFEDSGNGLQAATAAGLASIVTPTGFTVEHDFDGAARVIGNLQGVTVAHLRKWHAHAIASRLVEID